MEAWIPFNAQKIECGPDFNRLHFPVHTGNIQHTCYRVFSGIHLIYEDVHCKNHDLYRVLPETCFSISHCREGRMERHCEDQFYHIGGGDLSIKKENTGKQTSFFPSQHYHGISILIDVDRAPSCLSCFMEDVLVSPKHIMDKFCSPEPIYLVRSLPEVEHIFSELYKVPESIRKGYMKVKILELMLFLSAMEKQAGEFEKRTYTPCQKELAQKVSRYLGDHLSVHLTLEDLSRIFHVSGSQIKSAVKSVYGTTPSKLARTHRMTSAGHMLSSTDWSIMEIANAHGYDNASKFAAAFKAQMGQSPSSYRKKPQPLENKFV